MGLFSRWVSSNRGSIHGATKRFVHKAAGGLLGRFSKYATTYLPLHALPFDARSLLSEAAQVLPTQLSNAAANVVERAAVSAADRIDRSFLTPLSY